MNYDWVYPVWQYFEHKITLEQFKSQINDYLAQTPKHVLINMFNMLDSHDTMRIKHRLNEDMRRVMLAFVFMFVSCGAPNIYYGTEIGMTGAHDPDNRRTFPKDKTTYDMDFFNFLKKLIQIREQYPSLKAPDYLFTNSNVLSFYKELNDERILVLINNTLDAVEINMTSMKGTYINLFTEEKVTINDILKMNSYDFLLLKEVTYETDN
jgi:glycosidase